jgi:hypothetical protein
VTEVPPITPSTAAVTPVQQSAPVAPPPPVHLTDLVVSQLPAAMAAKIASALKTAQPQSPPPPPLEGRVILSNPQAQNIRIQTAEGEIVVQSQANLAPDTKISLQLSAKNSQTLADIVVAKQPAPPVIRAIKTALPMTPALQENSVVTAILLPNLKPMISPDVKAIPSSDIALPTTRPEINKPLVSTPPLLLPVQEEITGQKQPLPTLLQKFFAAYLPQILTTKPEAPLPSTPPFTPTLPEIPEVIDDNLLNIVRAKIDTKESQQHRPQTPFPLPTTKDTAVPVLKNIDKLFAFIENIKPQQNSFSAALQQMIPDSLKTPLAENIVQLTILKIFPPNTPPAEIEKFIRQQSAVPAATPPQSAKVETKTTGGLPILHSAESDLVIKTPVTVPTGSVIVFSARPVSAEQLIALSTGREFVPLFNTPWASLQETMDNIAKDSPDIALLVKNTLPSPTPKFIPTALFFLAALQRGNIANWLGEDVLKTLKLSGKKDLLTRLTTDFEKLSTQAKEPLSGEWKSISIPLLYEEKINMMQFFVRHHTEQDNREDAENAGKTTRFVLNLNLSRIGDLQLDGFVRQKNFDMILRTADKLPFTMRQELMRHFASGLEQVNMQGTIGFQTKQQQWVTFDLPQQTGMTA